MISNVMWTAKYVNLSAQPNLSPTVWENNYAPFPVATTQATQRNEATASISYSPKQLVRSLQLRIINCFFFAYQFTLLLHARLIDITRFNAVRGKRSSLFLPR